jgi:hypothetical protein
MVTVPEATRSAMAFARAALGEERTKGLQLEEIESGTEGSVDVWRITLSMADSDALDPYAVLSGRRDYKAFAVAKETGEVLSMKIRALSQA